MADILSRQMKIDLKDDEVFWVRVSRLKNVLEPLVSSIARLEGDVPNIEIVFPLFREI